MKPAKDLFKDSWLFFKSHWTTFVVISIGFAIVSYIYNNLLPGLVSSIFTRSLDIVNSTWISIFLYSIGVVIFITFTIGSILLSCAQSMLPPFITQALLDEKPLMFKDVTKRIVRMSPGYIWLSVLKGLIIVGGLLLCIVPGLYFVAVFTFATIAFIVDGKKGFAALAHSQALFKGRFWMVIGKVTYPILYMIALSAIIMSIIISLIVLNAPLWVIVSVLIIVGIPTLVAFFTVAYISVVYNIKLYRELTANTQVDVTVIPKWVKVWPWIGILTISIALMFGISYAVKHPDVIATFKNRIEKAMQSTDSAEPLSIERLEQVQVYDASGLNFKYPGRFVDNGPSDTDGSLAVFTDVLSPSKESGYVPQMTISGFQPKDDVQDMNGLEVLKKHFEPYFVTGTKDGVVKKYTIEEKTFNGHNFALISSEEIVDGQAAVTLTVLYKDKYTIYLIQFVALETEKDVIEQLFKQVFDTIRIDEVM